MSGRIRPLSSTYYDYAARAVAEVEAGEQAVTALSESPVGLLRVTAPLDLQFLGPICSEYLRLFPQVQLELVCTDRLVDLVEEGFDVGIRAGRLAESSLVARKLTSWVGVVVASRDYLARRGTPKTPADLAQHDCIVFGSGDGRAQWRLNAGKKSSVVEVRGRVVTNDLTAIDDALRAGLGVALLPLFRCAAELGARRLRRILAAWCSPPVPLYAVYPSTRHLSPKVSSFVRHLQQSMTVPPWHATPPPDQ